MSRGSSFEELSFFRNYDENVVLNFLDIAMHYLNSNVKPKVVQSAAQKLETDPGTVSSVIEKLAYLLVESEKHKITESDFRRMFDGILPDMLVTIIWEGLGERREQIQELLLKLKPEYTSYSCLDWRLEYTLASRSLQQQNEVKLLMCLNLKEKDAETQKHIECDIPNLFHLTNTLELALNETKSSHVRKVQRSFK